MSTGRARTLSERQTRNQAVAFPFGTNASLDTLSRLLLGGDSGKDYIPPSLSRSDFDEMAALAQSNHVIVRGLERFRQIMEQSGDAERAQWAEDAIAEEQGRIENAVWYLQRICDSLGAAGCEVMVIKSLDHWPDLGSDLDLYTNAEPAKVIRVMSQQLQAKLASRSWGDRLANKWNFLVPGLPESVEVHIGRLGQTGEQVAVANSLIQRARVKQVGRRRFRVTSAEDRLLICTLQRMYRHFYARLCDIVDTAHLLETETIDYEKLQMLAQASGIWEGVATFLNIVSDYLEQYRGRGLALPLAAREAAQFGGEQLRFGKDFLRVTILPHSARLYTSELRTLVTKGELRNMARLGLLPCLAAAAALQYKLTGSDKGIW